MVVADVMVVTTGYTGHDIQDFADQPLVYDLVCGSWHRSDKEGISYFPVIIIQCTQEYPALSHLMAYPVRILFDPV